MSKKQTKKAPAKKAAEKKSVKGIVIAAVALLLFAATVIAVVLIKKNNDAGNDVTKPIVTLPNDGGQYTYAEYGGSSLPVEFVEVLNQAAADSQAACEKYGVALEIGDRKISLPEFVLYYFDEYTLQIQGVAYSYQQTGENRTGYDTTKLPEEQTYPSQNYTWAEDFTEKAIEAMTANYSVFDQALAAGTKLDVMTIGSTIANCNRVDDYSRTNNKEANDMLAEIYCEGVTAAMFKAREIMIAYAERYEEEKTVELQQGYSAETVEAKFNEDKHAHTLVVGRVYPIEGDYNEAEVAAVKTEQEFIDYAQKNYPSENYNSEVATQCYYVNRDTISSTFGDEVGGWMFSDERKAGDIAVVQGMLFKYLVYIETPPFLSTSREIITCEQTYEDSMTEEEKAELFKSARESYKEWKADGGKEEDFLNWSLNSGNEGQKTVRAGYYYYKFNDWIFDSARKSGDSTVIDSDVGYCVIYYVGNNADDYDWDLAIRQEMSVDELKQIYEEIRSKDYKVERKQDVMAEAYETANKGIKKNMETLEF